MIPEEFPTVWWGGTRASFLPDPVPPPPAPSTAALVFALDGERLVVADIIGRGLCIPSGHIETGETAEQAARREAYEEAGITLGPLHLVGCYLLSDGEGTLCLAPTYVARVLRREAPPTGSESRGALLLSWEDLPSRYFLWDPLIAAVCAHARLRATAI